MEGNSGLEEAFVQVHQAVALFLREVDNIF